MKKYIYDVDLKRQIAVESILGHIKTLEDIERIIDNMEPAPVEELRPKAKWKSYHEADFGWDEWGSECSNCGFRLERGEVEFVIRYCPKCGAEME